MNRNLSKSGLIILIIAVLPVFFLYCKKEELKVDLIYSFPIGDVEGIIDYDLIEFDRDITKDGKGSIRISTEIPIVVRLYKLDNPDIHDLTLIYKAFVKTKGLRGNVFLEMRITFEKTIQIARGMASKISSDTEFTEIDTIFFLKKRHFPESVELNLVIEGRGTVWIDDIRLYKGPLTFLRAREF